MMPIRSVLTLTLALPAGLLFTQDPTKPPPQGVYREIGSNRFLNFVGRVFAVSFSPDGKTLAASCWDGTLWVGDVATGRILQQWEARQGWSRVHAFSPDGKTLASIGEDPVVHLWDVTTGKSLRELHGHTGQLQWVAFSGDGRLLGSQCTKSLRLWKVPSYEEVRRVDKFFTGCAPAMAATGSLLAYAPDRESLHVVDPASGQQVRKIDVALPNTCFLDFSADGKHLVLYPNDREMRWWHVGSGRELASPVVQSFSRGNVALAPDGRTMALTRSRSTIEVLELPSGQLRLHLRDLEMGACLAFSPDGRTLAIGSIDRSVLLWDLTGRWREDDVAPLHLSVDQLQALWKDLQADNGMVVHQAIWKLVAGAKVSVPFLGKQLTPVQAAEPQSTARLVRDLDSPQFVVRKRAFEALTKLGEAAEDMLQARLKERLPVETRRRIEQLTERNEMNWATQWQTLRALEVLEHIGPAAKDLLARLAAGAPAARLTKQAQAALQRLKRAGRLQ